MKKPRSQSDPKNKEAKSSPLYSISLVRSAEKELLNLRDPIFSAVADHLQQLSANPRPPGSAKLTARSEYKLRIGDIRIIYEINDKAREIIVLMIDNREQVYRRIQKRK